MTFKLNLKNSQLSASELDQLREMRKRCARRILLSTTLAASGHPGGSLSSLDLLLVVYGCIRHDPSQPLWRERDRVVVSIGHISPGVYSVLSEFGYFPEDVFLSDFRRAGSCFPGHVEHILPGVEWGTGNLGQGLSTAVGIALALKIKAAKSKVIVFMGDGEQQKGQIAEAIRFAAKYRLDNLIAIVDRNHLQICGQTDEVMPQKIRDGYALGGWSTHYLEDGHDYNSIFKTFSRIYNQETGSGGAPSVIIARTIMGKGISFMENQAKYHGSPLKPEQLADAFKELGLADELDAWKQRRSHPVSNAIKMERPSNYPEISPGEPVTYTPDVKTDNRSAYGNALLSLSQANNLEGKCAKIVGVSCDLEGSVKMGGFRKHSPHAYFEAGIQEHHAASMTGGLSVEGFASFFSTFGVFAVSEAYNQTRLNDINKTNVKIVATHLGLDVGEDGPTHQSIDYLSLLKNLYGFSVFMPADPNQTDRVIRFIATQPGNHFVGMGRSTTPVITNEQGAPFFADGYEFAAGRGDWIRKGVHGTFITYGSLTPYVMHAWKILSGHGISAGVLSMASLVPIDRDAVIQAAKAGPVLTIEDHNVNTGLGCMVGVILAEEGLVTSFARLGVTGYGSSGKPADLYASQGLDPDSLVKAFRKLAKK